MSGTNQVANQSTQNTVPVQAVFDVNGVCLGLISQGQFFSPPITQDTITSSTITSSTIDSTTIGATTPSTGAFTTLSYSSTLTGGTGIVNLGSGQFYKDASGNVGIGTSSPIYKLDVQSTGANQIRLKGGTGTNQGSSIFITNANNSNTFMAIGDLASITGGTPDALAGWYTNTSVPIVFLPSGTERMRITSGGNVGIGTSNPTTQLQIESATTATITLTSTSNNNLILSCTSTTASIGSPNGVPLFFSTSNIERMRIDISGNVGIGNTVATTIAAVNGGGTLVVGNGGANNQGITIYTGSSNSGILNFANGTTTTSTYAGYIAYNHTGNRMEFGTNATERMRIDSVGNIGIGTISPSSSAILDAQSTTKGVRMPNMTTTQKNAIASPVAGLMVFDTTLAKLCVYSGSAWQTITSV